MDQMQQQVICVGGIKIAYEDSSCSSSLTVLYPTCRICQMSFSDKGGRLITPCRCKGSLKHVHGTCLRKWVEMRQRYKKYEFPDRCELCGYQYRKTKYIKCKKLRLPRMDTRDKVYHSVSLASLCIMMACLILSIYCILFDTNSGANKEKYKHPDGEQFQFTVGEMVTLCSGVIFFMSFILAMTVEIKSRHTIFEVIKRMLRYNTVWVIENYDKAADKEYCASDSNSSK
ncbi:hypothetical protein EB796_022370 [Bugula neritina]|uniref:RING-CH-type domain-containing protein n=1 Tax=Bugula neritina TaxID=10212 RepID=A0A7J7IZI7_BUGNE|nr:hypothetical protein EB796_022370 [Bugula neritina]